MEDGHHIYHNFGEVGCSEMMPLFNHSVIFSLSLSLLSLCPLSLSLCCLPIVDVTLYFVLRIAFPCAFAAEKQNKTGFFSIFECLH